MGESLAMHMPPHTTPHVTQQLCREGGSFTTEKYGGHPLDQGLDPDVLMTESRHYASPSCDSLGRAPHPAEILAMTFGLNLPGNSHARPVGHLTGQRVQLLCDLTWVGDRHTLL